MDGNIVQRITQDSIKRGLCREEETRFGLVKTLVRATSNVVKSMDSV